MKITNPKPTFRSQSARSFAVMGLLILFAMPGLQTVSGNEGGDGGNSPQPAGETASGHVRFNITLMSLTDINASKAHIADINESNQIVGTATVSGLTKAFVWTPGSPAVLLNSLLSPEDRAIYDLVQAAGNNDLGEIAGRAKHLPTGLSRPVIITLPVSSGAYASIEDLGWNPSEVYPAVPQGINNASEIVGEQAVSGPTPYWSPSTGPSQLMSSILGQIGVGVKIDNDGMAVGFFGGPKAVYWPTFQDMPVVIPAIGLDANGGTQNQSYSSNSGIVVGRSSAGVYSRGSLRITILRAFKYDTQSGVLTNLGSLGGSLSSAKSINAAGTIIGGYNKSISSNSAPTEAFYYTPADGSKRLSDLVNGMPSTITFPCISSAGVINDVGNVAVTLNRTNTVTQPALLTKLEP